MDLGFDAAGWTPVAQVERDEQCLTVLRRHWPNVPKWGDIVDVNGLQLPETDAVIFGSPCQDLSVAGTYTGLSGSRSGLFFEAVRVIREIRSGPAGTHLRWVVWENVPGALSSHKGADFAVVLDSLAHAGAVVIEWGVLDARWFGLPQRRRRLYLAACFDPAARERCPDPLLPVGEGVSWDHGTGEPGGADSSQGAAGRSSRPVFVKATRARAKNGSEKWVDGYDCPAPTLNTFERTAVRATVVVVEPGGPRRLTPVECERLQGWPDGHTAGLADYRRFEMVGNGVASPVAEWVGRQILVADGCL